MKNKAEEDAGVQQSDSGVKWTPGPIHVNLDNCEYPGRCDHDHTCRIHKLRWYIRERDAALSELYEALYYATALLEYINQQGSIRNSDTVERIKTQARAALAKARGETRCP
jgi:hypothetical protein